MLTFLLLALNFSVVIRKGNKLISLPILNPQKMKELVIFYCIIFLGVIAPNKTEFYYLASTQRCEKSV